MECVEKDEREKPGDGIGVDMTGCVIAFAGGVVVGSFFGIITAAMCVVASEADRKAERREDENGKHR